jgi:hypothetical protein
LQSLAFFISLRIFDVGAAPLCALARMERFFGMLRNAQAP